MSDEQVPAYEPPMLDVIGSIEELTQVETADEKMTVV